MEAIILGNPTDIELGSVTPITIPAYEAEQAVIKLSDGYNPYTIGTSSGTDTYWFRYSTGLLRPTTSTDSIVIGGTSLISTETLRVVGSINSTSYRIGSGITISSFLDEDDMVSDSATALPTQQSVKAYVDSKIGNYLESGDNISLLTNDSGYITTESDPIFLASPSYGITSTLISNWNSAYGWGNHALVGYITTETDPIFTASVAYSIASTDVTNWNTAYGWGDWSTQGFITTETDPIFLASAAYNVTSTLITNWNTAYTNNHTHSNKTLLDSLITSGSSDLYLNAAGTYSSPSLVSTTDYQLLYGVSGALTSNSGLIWTTSTNMLTTTNATISNYLYIGSTGAYIADDGSGNLSFYDTIYGSSITLSTLSSGATNYWTSITNGIYYTNYVGVNSPSSLDEALTVNGNIQGTQFNSKYYRYNGNWLIGSGIGASLVRTNTLAFDITDNTSPLFLADATLRTVEVQGDAYVYSGDLHVANATDTQYIQFETSPTDPSTHTEGLAYWNSDLGVLNVMSDISGCVQQVGLETWVRVYNNTSSTISAGTPVYITSASGDLVYIAPAKANSESTCLTTIGLATDDIAASSEGFVTVHGIVHDLSTTGLTEGAIVYVSATTAGALTTTRPTAPNITVGIGVCTVKDASVGSIAVSMRVQPTLERLSNIYISGVTDDQVLSWDADNSRWYNRSITSTPPSDGILDWDTTNNRYQPYSAQQSIVSFDLGSVYPTLTTRLNINANLYATNLYSKSLVLSGSTSGTTTIVPTAIAGTTTQTLQAVSGTIALTSDLHDAVTIGTDANGLSLSTQVLSLALATSSNNGALSSTDWTTFNSKEPALGSPTTDGYVLTSTSAGVRSWVSITSAITPTDNFLYWNSTSNYYTPYSAQQTSLVSFDLSSTDPTLTTRLNLNALLYATAFRPSVSSSNPGDTYTLWINSGDSNKLYFGSTKVGSGDTIKGTITNSDLSTDYVYVLTHTSVGTNYFNLTIVDSDGEVWSNAGLFRRISTDTSWFMINNPLTVTLYYTLTFF